MNLVGKPVRFCHWSREPIENDGHSFRSRGSTEKKRLETWCWNSQFVKYRNPQRALVTRRVRMTLLSRSKRPKDRFRSKDKSKWRKIAHCCNWRSEEKLIWVKLRRGGALDLNKKKTRFKMQLDEPVLVLDKDRPSFRRLLLFARSRCFVLLWWLYFPFLWAARKETGRPPIDYSGVPHLSKGKSRWKKNTQVGIAEERKKPCVELGKIERKSTADWLWPRPFSDGKNKWDRPVKIFEK